MARDITPTQSRFNDAYRNISFPSKINDYQVFASKIFSNLLKSFGDDIILDGFDISNIDHTPTDVSLTVGSGWAIIDGILAKITTASDLVYPNANLLSTNGRFITYLSYKYYQQFRPNINELYVQLSYVSSAGVVSPGWVNGRDRIVIDIFEFALCDGCSTNSFVRSSDGYITIDGTDYYKYGNNNDNVTKLFNNCKDLLIHPDALRDGNGESINCNFKNYITSVLYSTILGEFRLVFTYNTDWIITAVKSYFRDLLVLTTDYTYDNNGDLISWVES